MELDDILVILLAGGSENACIPLTKDRAKPAVYFGGPYRIIDFTLSNCINSGCGISTSPRSTSRCRSTATSAWVERRLRRAGEFIEILPPQKARRRALVSRHRRRRLSEPVLDHARVRQPHHRAVGRSRLQDGLREDAALPLETSADATLATIEVPHRDASRFGIVSIDEGDRVIGFEEKPRQPTPAPGSPDSALASMGIYIFRATCSCARSKTTRRAPTASTISARTSSRADSVVAGLFYRFYDENKKARSTGATSGRSTPTSSEHGPVSGQPGVQPVRSGVAAAHVSAAGAAAKFVFAAEGTAAARRSTRSFPAAASSRAAVSWAAFCVPTFACTASASSSSRF
jgi:glucose-1-phosphate adenylyltransferase